MADPTPSHSDSAGDGTMERILKRTSRASTAAIFIHAGAGYHSQANERIHLEACNEFVFRPPTPSSDMPV